NAVVDIIRRAPEGSSYPAREELHSPEITSSHIKELGAYLRAAATGIVSMHRRENDLHPDLPFAIVNLVSADVDPGEHPGFGGQVPVQDGLFVTFVLSAYIRELGFHASVFRDEPRLELAVAAGLGRLNPEGRFAAPALGTRVYVADVIRTDLPLAADR
ncbi:MAG: hypothetical protein IT307_10015, partial [Chloroflexi bacterium]|nr:hypothetical protein [Chloroflexota bacterium]